MGLWDKGDLALFHLWHWKRHICSEFELVPSGLNALYPLLFFVFKWFSVKCLNLILVFLGYYALIISMNVYKSTSPKYMFLFSSMIFLNNLQFILVVFFCCRLQHVIMFVLTQQVYDFQTCNYCRCFRSSCLFQHAILSSIKYYGLWY